jgi:hypothetical protein
VHLRSDNALYFANAEYTIDHILDRLREPDTPVKYLLLDLQATTFIDMTGIDELRRLLEEAALEKVRVSFMGVHRPVLSVFRTSGFLDDLAPELLIDRPVDAVKPFSACWTRTTAAPVVRIASSTNVRKRARRRLMKAGFGRGPERAGSQRPSSGESRKPGWGSSRREPEPAAKRRNSFSSFAVDLRECCSSSPKCGRYPTGRWAGNSG